MRSVRKRSQKSAGRSRMKCCRGSILCYHVSRATRDRSEALILAAEIQDGADSSSCFERLRRQDFTQKDLVIAAGIDFNRFALKVCQRILEQRLTRRTFKINAPRPVAVLFGKQP